MKCPYCNEDMAKGLYSAEMVLIGQRKNNSLLLCLHWEKEEHRLRMGVLKITPICSVVNFEFNEVNKYVYHL